MNNEDQNSLNVLYNEKPNHLRQINPRAKIVAKKGTQNHIESLDFYGCPACVNVAMGLKTWDTLPNRPKLPHDSFLITAFLRKEILRVRLINPQNFGKMLRFFSTNFFLRLEYAELNSKSDEPNDENSNLSKEDPPIFNQINAFLAKKTIKIEDLEEILSSIDDHLNKTTTKPVFVIVDLLMTCCH